MEMRFKALGVNLLFWWVDIIYGFRLYWTCLSYLPDYFFEVFSHSNQHEQNFVLSETCILRPMW
jgi:hypothetical protein